MQGMTGKRVLLGVSGGIAAYKSVELLRRLVKAGADVRVVMTASAQKFIQPLTFEALSRQPVERDLFPESGDPRVIHVDLAKWADLIVVAPATANSLGKLANGLADDLLSCILLAAESPVLLAPSMESQMYRHPSVQRNLEWLRSAGYRLMEPGTGELASGDSGVGRLPEPLEIAAAVESLLTSTTSLSGKTVLVTAGRTEEDLDPVRFITNRSTGKMGYAVARQAQRRGARVILVSGPTELAPPPGVEVRRVRTVAEMHSVTVSAFEEADALVMTAAVLDFRPESVAQEKIKKSGEDVSFTFVQTDDFLAEMGREKGNRIVVGFAMETENGPENARRKLAAKRLDLIVLNNLREEGAGFGVDTNVVTLLDSAGGADALPKMTKDEVAARILDRVEALARRPAVVDGTSVTAGNGFG